MVYHPGLGFRLLLLFNILIIVPKCWAANDTLTQSQPLLVGQTLSSSGNIFELGFFTPGNSSKLYVGIWYKIIPVRRFVWVANRENALSANDSASRLMIGSDGNLKLTDGEEKTVWSTNVTAKSNGTIAVLIDKGDFILKDNFSGLVLWESFYFPADTFLPNMLLGYNFKTREKSFLTSWETENDPSPGNFVVGLSEETPPQAFTWNGSKPYWRGGPWNGWKFIGIPDSDGGYENGQNLVQDNQQGTVYLTYNMFNNSYVVISSIEPSGSLKIFQWDKELNHWNKTWERPENPCDVYGVCGPYGVCSWGISHICQCLKGFVPKSDEEWGKGNWTSGCVRRTQLTCERSTSNLSSDRSEKDGFWKLSGIKLPDLYEYLYMIQDAEGCQQWCLNNCSCVAYAYPGGIGCMVWVKAPMDIRQFSFAGEDLYLRLANSELGLKKRQIKLITGLTVLGIIIVGISLYCFCRRKANKRVEHTTKRSSNQKKSGFKRNRIQDFLLTQKNGISRDISQDDILVGSASPRSSPELPLVDFTTIKKATNNFSVANKLGSGGFGTVYEGTLEDGQRIAVKRLSSHSGQGVEELKNEVLLISKLQHRNLVRLLGCCIQGEEKLLILECMKNNSLDTFLFDSTKRLQLDWAKRFNIIEGIARGLLYLHRDSCLRIIHRDLKASNILLDDDMNPKISDFGLARTFRVTQELGNTLRVVGTFGYMSPEYAMGGLFSEKSDVYSFGVLLLEIISSKKNTGFPYQEKYFNLLGYAWQLWSEGKVLDLMGESLAGCDSCSPSEVLRCIQIGLLCVQDHAADRPTMSNVVLMLSSEMDLPQPRQPTFTFQSMLDHDFQSPGCDKACSINEVTVSVMEGR